MILVDHAVGSVELIEPLCRMGLPAEKIVQPFGDVAFEGKGAGGKSVMVGIELKTVGDLISSLRSNRINDQLQGLIQTYDHRWLVIEGEWRVDKMGLVMTQGHRGTWKPTHGRMTVGELENRITTLEMMGGLHVRRTFTRRDTIHLLAGLYRWWTDRALDAHTSHLAVYQPSMIVPVSQFRATVMTLPGIGRKTSKAVEQHFKTLRNAFTASARDWTHVDGIGLKTASTVVRVIDGRD
jgi:ERCC4-type nuclease